MNHYTKLLVVGWAIFALPVNDVLARGGRGGGGGGRGGPAPAAAPATTDAPAPAPAPAPSVPVKLTTPAFETENLEVLPA